jgi:hypothetical protein
MLLLPLSYTRAVSRSSRSRSATNASNSVAGMKTAAVSLAELTAAERAGVDAFWVLRNLRINAVQSMRHGDRAAAARSIELIGKHLGLFVDKKRIEVSYIDDADEYLAKIMAIVDAKTVEHEPAPLAIGHEPTEQDDGAHWQEDTAISMV